MSLYIKKIDDKKNNIIVIDYDATDNFFDLLYIFASSISKSLSPFLYQFFKPALNSIYEYKNLIKRYGKYHMKLNGNDLYILIKKGEKDGRKTRKSNHHK